MEFVPIDTTLFPALLPLHRAYKAAIGEAPPTPAQEAALGTAIADGRILFYACLVDGQPVACCSVCITYSTYHYRSAGVLEDFFIHPAHRHRGIARQLVAYAHAQSAVDSLTVGCADCDVELYRAIGFTLPLGNLLAYAP